MILRVCLCLPTYNNPSTIETVALEALRGTDYPILIVDDGSTQPVVELLTTREARAALEAGRLRVLRLETNQGKGRALQAGVRDCVARGFTHLFSIDADGQHLISEVPKLVDIAKRYPWDLVIGKRRMEGETVPGISHFGRAFSNYWVNYQTGTRISDSQSGFRLYPLFHLQNVKFWTKRYDFEIEVLIRLLWKGVSVHEVEIECFYPEKHERVSHFDKLWDNVRISVLNTILVGISLLRSHRSPSEVALAVGAGVFIGCTPFFGLHTLLVAVVAFLFRLNAVFLFLGSQISIPPLAPFLVLGSIAIGRSIIGFFQGGTPLPWVPPIDTTITGLVHFAGAQFGQWLLGSVALGATLGTCAGLGTYVLSSRLKRSRGTGNWNGRTRGGVIGNGFLNLVLRFMGLKAGYFCLLFIIPYFYLFAPKARRSLNEYWRLREPQIGSLRRQWFVMKHLFRFGQVLMDRLVNSHSAKTPFHPNSSGFENIVESAAQRKGVILLGAHVGSWDLAASLMEEQGFSESVTLAEHKADGFVFDRLKGKVQKRHVQVLATNRADQPIFSIHELLSEGHPLGLMGDRPTGNRYELVTFLGHLAPFDVTPFRLAAATGTPLLITFGFKGRGMNYDMFATKAKSYVYPPGVAREVQCREWAQDYARELESALRRYPDQWFNFFPFWSSLPDAQLNQAESGTASAAPNHLEEELRKRASSEPAKGFGPKSTVEAESRR